MRHSTHQVEDWLHILCRAVHEESVTPLSGGSADWLVGALSDDYLVQIRRAEAMGYITIDEREDFGDERLVLQLTPSGRRLLGVPASVSRPTLMERLASFFRRGSSR